MRCTTFWEFVAIRRHAVIDELSGACMTRAIRKSFPRVDANILQTRLVTQASHVDPLQLKIRVAMVGACRRRQSNGLCSNACQSNKSHTYQAMLVVSKPTAEPRCPARTCPSSLRYQHLRKAALLGIIICYPKGNRTRISVEDSHCATFRFLDNTYGCKKADLSKTFSVSNKGPIGLQTRLLASAGLVAHCRSEPLEKCSWESHGPNSNLDGLYHIVAPQYVPYPTAVSVGTTPAPVGSMPCSSAMTSQNLAPIWFPHWPDIG